MPAVFCFSFASLALLASGAFPADRLQSVADAFKKSSDDVRENIALMVPDWVPIQMEILKEEMNPSKAKAKADGARKGTSSAKAVAAVDTTVDLPALIMQERAVLKAAMQTVSRYNGATAFAQKVAGEESAAEKEVQKKSAVVDDATTRLSEAKGMRVAAAQFDLQSMPMGKEHTESQSRLTAAEATVAAAQKTLEVVTKAAKSASDKAKKVEARAGKADARQAKLELEMIEAHDEVQRLSGAIADQESEMKTGLTRVRTMEQSLDTAMEKQLPKVSKSLRDGSSSGSNAERKH